MSAPSDYARQLFPGDVVTKAVLRTIADFADWTTGRCFPKVETIAKWAQCSEDTVRRRIKKLEKLGLLKVEKRKNSTNIYTLTGFKQWLKEEKERKNNKKKVGGKHAERGSSQLGQEVVEDSLTARSDLADSDPRPRSQLPKLTYLTTNKRTISFEDEKKKEMNEALSVVYNEEPRVEIRENKIVLCKDLRELWLKEFNNQEKQLDLALLQIAPQVQTWPSRGPAHLESSVSSRLAQICRERRERDERYAAAVTSKQQQKEVKPWKPSRW